jgi:hypothetical protein
MLFCNEAQANNKAVAMSAHTAELIEHTAPCAAASAAAATLIVLSWFNAVHSPMFDCIRAGAQLWRSRRNLASAEVCIDGAVRTLRPHPINLKF